ncbi:MAG: Dam family site-specific DNA-(adenine-N6)-methyltransferase [Thiotrichales bacterium]|nr:Dam family site-specific DNA-(adenine-N6)-methyltransferase [Thiotrichales bacterium]
MNAEHFSRPFLKWPGGKYRLVRRISDSLGPGQRLVEPFVGSGAVFLNSHYRKYLLADGNPHLIGLYRILQNEGEEFIRYCGRFFVPENNVETVYYKLRKQFNETGDERLQSALFVYLNRHCYNGLCRYNSKGIFNSPFGRYKRPYFPQREMHAFQQRSKTATFSATHYLETMAMARSGDVVYCDPPYIPLSPTSSFTDYFAGGFSEQDQVELARQAGRLAKKGVQVVISNHNTRFTRDLYIDAGATMSRFKVQRNISCRANARNKVGELLAVFG